MKDFLICWEFKLEHLFIVMYNCFNCIRLCGFLVWIIHL